MASRKTLNTRRMEFFKSYNTPRLMGVQGCNVDGFLARLGKDVMACKLETFNWKDYQILTCINTLTNDKDEVQLAEKFSTISFWLGKTRANFDAQQREIPNSKAKTGLNLSLLPVREFDAFCE